ncbi:hypothetical protein LP420_16260 [Massilia sp. B-10]|nr:hypothetical protein LP420_16260 [Massilia sp. B-10]
MLARAAIDYEIEILPWKRAWFLAQSRSDTCIYSVSRIPEREKLFKWIGPINTSDWTLFGRSGRDYKLTTIEEDAQIPDRRLFRRRARRNPDRPGLYRRHGARAPGQSRAS